jgi:hypothetical protein
LGFVFAGVKKVVKEKKMLMVKQIALILMTGMFGLCHAFAQFEKSEQWIPANSNMLILVNAERMMQSEMAVKENWASSRAFERGSSILPPGVGTAFFASQFDFQMMEPLWTVGVFKGIDAKARLTEAAARLGSEEEALMGRSSAQLSGDLFGVAIDAETIGVHAPSNRQAVARWLSQGDANRISITPYLAQAIEFADKNADIIIAFDMANSISAGRARSRLMKLDSISASDVTTLSAAAERLQGMTLGITIRDKSYGALKIDFEPGTRGLDRVGRRLILSMLADNGLMIDDVESWEITTQERSVTFGGWLTPTGLRQISLLVNQPIRDQFSGRSAAGESQTIDTARNTAEFLESIELYLRELEDFLRRHRDSRATAYARWFDKYATKIDSMSIIGVDSQAVDFAAMMSREFRNVAMVLTRTQGNINSRTIAEREYGNFQFFGDFYGHRSRNMASGQLVKAQETASATDAAKTIMQELRNQYGDLRRAMSTKYNFK